MVITYKQLKDFSACEKELELFAIIFGESVEVTLENCITASQTGFNLEWVAHRFLFSYDRNTYLNLRESAFDIFWTEVAALEKQYILDTKPLEKYKGGLVYTEKYYELIGAINSAFWVKRGKLLEDRNRLCAVALHSVLKDY